MSTVLVSLGVVAAAICVLMIALSDPDQPATLTRATGRAGPRRQRSPRPEPVPREAEPVPREAEPVPREAEPVPRVTEPVASSSAARVPSRALAPSVARRLWTRARSAVALLVLVTFTGVVLAALVGTGLAVAVRAFTRAVR